MISFHCTWLAGRKNAWGGNALLITTAAPPHLAVYAQPNDRDGGANASAYEQMFSSASGWLNTVQNIVNARDAINPSVSAAARAQALRGAFVGLRVAPAPPGPA